MPESGPARGEWGQRVACMGLSVVLSGCLPFLLPPGQVSLGAAGVPEQGAVQRVAVGARAASLSTEADFPLDVGAGYTSLRTPNDGRRPTAHGLYLEGGPRIAGGDIWRSFATGRVEFLLPRTGQPLGYSLLGRLSLEAFLPLEYAPVGGFDGKNAFVGVAYGMVALGPYAEAGYLRLPGGESSLLIGGGIEFRWAALGGVVCCAWDLLGKSKRSGR